MKRTACLASLVLLLGAGCFPKPATWPSPAAEPAALPVVAPTPAATSTQTEQPPAPAATKPTTIVKPKTPVPSPKPANGYVTIQNLKFGPQILAVNAGATVTWTNKDSVHHTVDSDAIRIFNSGNLPVGASFKHTFNSPGTYTYHCSVHPGMTGTIVVR